MGDMDGSLAQTEAEALRRADLTYAEVGATAGTLPEGYHHLRRRMRVGRGEACFAELTRIVMSWGIQRGAGLAVRASEEYVAEGAVAVVRLGLGPVGVDAPVRVVYTIDEPHRRGFAYGTLPGHAERGEEAFVAEIADDGDVELCVTAFSRPATVAARAGWPMVRLVQRLVTARYLAAAAGARKVSR